VSGWRAIKLKVPALWEVVEKAWPVIGAVKVVAQSAESRENQVLAKAVDHHGHLRANDVKLPKAWIELITARRSGQGVND
jgi:hypothetical protein